MALGRERTRELRPVAWQTARGEVGLEGADPSLQPPKNQLSLILNSMVVIMIIRVLCWISSCRESGGERNASKC